MGVFGGVLGCLVVFWGVVGCVWWWFGVFVNYQNAYVDGSKDVLFVLSLQLCYVHGMTGKALPFSPAFKNIVRTDETNAF